MFIKLLIQLKEKAPKIITTIVSNFSNPQTKKKKSVFNCLSFLIDYILAQVHGIGNHETFKEIIQMSNTIVADLKLTSGYNKKHNSFLLLQSSKQSRKDFINRILFNEYDDTEDEKIKNIIQLFNGESTNLVQSYNNTLLVSLLINEIKTETLGKNTVIKGLLTNNLLVHCKELFNVYFDELNFNTDEDFRYFTSSNDESFKLINDANNPLLDEAVIDFLN